MKKHKDLTPAELGERAVDPMREAIIYMLTSRPEPKAMKQLTVVIPEDKYRRLEAIRDHLNKGRIRKISKNAIFLAGIEAVLETYREVPSSEDTGEGGK